MKKLHVSATKPMKLFDKIQQQQHVDNHVGGSDNNQNSDDDDHTFRYDNSAATIIMIE